MHQGYHFDFLRGVGPDPEVWSYTEGTWGPVWYKSHFTDWLGCVKSNWPGVTG